MSFLEERRPWNFYRLGPSNEKNYFKRNKESYTGIIIPAHIASYYSKFCFELISEIGKPYFIDPMTYVFARNPDILRRYVKGKNKRTLKDDGGNKKRGDIKSSYKKLADIYGGSIKEAIGKTKATQVECFDQDYIEKFADQAIMFQKNIISQLPDKYKKYKKFAEKSGKSFVNETITPDIVIPPYFFFDDINDSWYNVNLKSALYASAKYKDDTVFPVIFTNTSALDDSKCFDRIVSEYCKLDVKGYIVWIDQFKGTDANIGRQRIVRDLINSLSSNGKHVILMYCDAFYQVLHWFGLSGFSAGICYAEKKGVDQDFDIEGQLAPRYYFRALRRKIQIETEVPRINLSNYPNLSCDCRVCSSLGDPKNFDEEATKEHFMLARRKEIDALLEVGIEEFKNDLFSNFNLYRDDTVLGPVPYLINWYNLFNA